MLVVSLLIGVCSIASVYLGSKTAMLPGGTCGSALPQGGELLPGEINEFGTPSLITRNTNDVQQVQMLVALGLSMMIMAPMMSVGGIIMALRQDVPLSAILLVILPVMVVLWLLVRQGPPAVPVDADEARPHQPGHARDSGGVRVIRAFVRTDCEERRFDEANPDLTGVSLRVIRLFALMIPALFVILNLHRCHHVVRGSPGGERWHAHRQPDRLHHVRHADPLFAVMIATVMLAMMPRAAASGDRVQEVLDVRAVDRRPGAPPDIRYRSTAGAGLVEFKDVEFRYPGAEDPVLSNISFTAPPGRRPRPSSAARAAASPRSSA